MVCLGHRVDEIVSANANTPSMGDDFLIIS